MAKLIKKFKNKSIKSLLWSGLSKSENLKVILQMHFISKWP